MSMEAVAHLRTAGLSARRLEFGFPEWRASGRPVASLPHIGLIEADARSWGRPADVAGEGSIPP